MQGKLKKNNDRFIKYMQLMKLIKMVKKERDDNAKREQSNQNTYV